jgi:hypothetical protein
VNSGKRVISSDHDALPVQVSVSSFSIMVTTTTNPMGRISQHLECLNGVRLKRGVKYQEPSKFEMALDFVPIQLLDLMYY